MWEIDPRHALQRFDPALNEPVNLFPFNVIPPDGAGWWGRVHAGFYGRFCANAHFL
jgi:hypothetical protein